LQRVPWLGLVPGDTSIQAVAAINIPDYRTVIEAPESVVKVHSKSSAS